MTHVLLSPLAGWSAPLEEVPDPVFCARMLGDGLAIDPLGATLHAPCDGVVAALAQSRHAVTLRTPYGADVLMHVGIDTVELRGEGFVSHIEAGQVVRAGDALISFDLDRLACRARSLLTPVLVLQGGVFAIHRRTQGRGVAVGDVLMELEAVVPSRPGEAQTLPLEAGEGIRLRVRVGLEHGIHARPAARVVTALKAFDAEVMLSARGREANARSTVALMALGVPRDGQIEIFASGADAAAAAEAVAAVLQAGQSRDGRPSGSHTRAQRQVEVPAQSSPPCDTRPAPVVAPAPGATLPGVTASRGLAVGTARVLAGEDIQVSEAGAGVERETAELHRARERVHSALQRALGTASGAAREIIEAHLTLIDDPELSQRALSKIAGGASAAFAWRCSIRESVEVLGGLDDPRLRERADDLIDLERQVLSALSGERVESALALSGNTILIAEELLPSQLLGVDAGKPGGICLAAGGATSHVSILAAALGIPALVALGPSLRRIADGTALILDADAAVLHVDPGEERLEGARRRIDWAVRRDALERQAAQRECRTADGVRIEVLANVGSLAEAQVAVRNGAEGCGLLRTEFLFLDRRDAPTEAEQLAEYQPIAAALAGRPVTIRTLDIGGDKPIPYLPLPREDNPALGLRGVRTSLWRPDLLGAQLRAILAVQPFGQCRILVPMVTDAAEIRSVRVLAEQAARQIGRSEAAEIGVMIETPASALMAEALAEEADFFSIGTNDLTQYTLAMDRGHAQLAARLDALHPAVLRLIGRTAEAAGSRNRPLAVCGGLASDPAAAPILIGLGVRELSCVPSAIPRLKAYIGGLTMEECTRLARKALSLGSAEAVRSLRAAVAGGVGEPASSGA